MKRILVQEPGLGSFDPKWDGPYTITGIVRPRTYRLSDRDGRNLRLPWNTDHLKRFYQSQDRAIQKGDLTRTHLPLQTSQLLWFSDHGVRVRSQDRALRVRPDQDPTSTSADNQLLWSSDHRVSYQDRAPCHLNPAFTRPGLELG
ncbi:hypothetical protein TIFTF001_027586 [Ficus carica]|uniref:Uncharacterized protein n=1 Tax=Ficus carica TaxID=3494 RepID=A0AA88DN84_FICCA|nr:hypothetical protein TIFTF001_027586 [Ficus carica]